MRSLKLYLSMSESVTLVKIDCEEIKLDKRSYLVRTKLKSIKAFFCVKRFKIQVSLRDITFPIASIKLLNLYLRHKFHSESWFINLMTSLLLHFKMTMLLQDVYPQVKLVYINVVQVELHLWKECA